MGFLISLGYHAARSYGSVSVSPTSSAAGVELKFPVPVYYSIVQKNWQVKHFQIYLKKIGFFFFFFWEMIGS